MRIIQILTLVLLSGESFAYTFFLREGNPLVWEIPTSGVRTIRFAIDPVCPPEFKQSFVKCAGKWSEALGGKIIFEENSEKEIFITLKNLTTDQRGQAELFVSDPGKNAFLHSARISLNARYQFSNISTGKDIINLDALMLHEIGHCLGLHHTSIEAASHPALKDYDVPTMYYFLSIYPDDTLHLDDINGVRARYNLPPLPNLPLMVSCEKIKGNRYRFQIPQVTGEYLILDMGYGFQRYHQSSIFRFKRGISTIKAQWNGFQGQCEIQIGKRRTLAKPPVAVSVREKYEVRTRSVLSNISCTCKLHTGPFESMDK